MLLAHNGSSLVWNSDHLTGYLRSDSNMSSIINLAGTDLISMTSTVEDSIDTWSATTIKPNYVKRNDNEEAKMPERGNMPNDYIVGSTLDLAPGRINYSTDGLTTYFTLMSYLMGTTFTL